MTRDDIDEKKERYIERLKKEIAIFDNKIVKRYKNDLKNGKIDFGVSEDEKDLLIFILLTHFNKVQKSFSKLKNSDINIVIDTNNRILNELESLKKFNLDFSVEKIVATIEKNMRLSYSGAIDELGQDRNNNTIAIVAGATLLNRLNGRRDTLGGTATNDIAEATRLFHTKYSKDSIDIETGKLANDVMIGKKPDLKPIKQLKDITYSDNVVRQVDAITASLTFDKLTKLKATRLKKNGSR